MRCRLPCWWYHAQCNPALWTGPQAPLPTTATPLTSRQALKWSGGAGAAGGLWGWGRRYRCSVCVCAECLWGGGCFSLTLYFLQLLTNCHASFCCLHFSFRFSQFKSGTQWSVQKNKKKPQMNQTLDVPVDSGFAPLPFSILHKSPFGSIHARAAICDVLSAPAHQQTALSAARKNVALCASFVSGAAHFLDANAPLSHKHLQSYLALRSDR